MKAQKFIPLLVIGVGLLVYHNSFPNPFIFDDLQHIVENPRIRQLWPPWGIIMHTSRPVVLLSLAVNYALGGLNPWGYHLFNVGIHILAALTLYGVARLTFASEALESLWGGAAPWMAGVISLIWLVHPLQTESVTYTIQRGESLIGLFYLLTLYCVIRSTEPSRRIWWQVGAVVSCALGMASKPVMVTAPVVVLLYDCVFLAKSWREVMERRWALYASLAATWLLLPLFLANGPSDWKTSAGFAYKGIPPLQYALTQPGVILHYLRLAFWPHPLCFDYGWEYGWPPVRTARDALPDLIVVGALLAATAWAWWRKPALGFLGVWLFMILAPTSSFVPVADLVFEHRMYLPLAAVVALVTVGGFVVGRDLLSAWPKMQRMLGCGVSAVLVVLLAILAIQRNHDYRSALAIWQDTVVKCPENTRAHNNLGKALLDAGSVQEAIGHFEQALQIKPDYAVAHDNLGAALAQVGRFHEAADEFGLALQIQSDFAEAHYNMGRALVRLGRVQEAIMHYEQALRSNPSDAEAHYELGNALIVWGKTQEAIAHWEQAVRIKPDYADARNNLGAALAQAGRFQEAIEQLDQVLRITPCNAEAHCNLGNTLLQVGKVREAIGHYEHALRIKPDFLDAQNSLAGLLATLASAEGGDPARAVTLAQQVCEITSNQVPAYLDTLAAAYAAVGRFNDAVATAQKAIELARAAVQPQVVTEIEGRLESYRSGHVYRQLRTPVRSQPVDVTSPHNP
ncbi:MAG: tetratricopeptide repeat protein [Verrucomicrobiia bacterium]